LNKNIQNANAIETSKICSDFLGSHHSNRKECCSNYAHVFLLDFHIRYIGFPCRKGLHNIPRGHAREFKESVKNGLCSFESET
jgi:hypothetical protein